MINENIKYMCMNPNCSAYKIELLIFNKITSLCCPNCGNEMKNIDLYEEKE